MFEIGTIIFSFISVAKLSDSHDSVLKRSKEDHKDIQSKKAVTRLFCGTHPKIFGPVQNLPIHHLTTQGYDITDTGDIGIYTDCFIECSGLMTGIIGNRNLALLPRHNRFL